MKDPYGKRDFERGKKAAYEMGAEYQANPGSDLKEYKDSAAFYFRENVESFEHLTKEEKRALSNAFGKGREAEKKYQ